MAVNPWRFAAIEFAQGKSVERAAIYRERAATLLAIANSELDPARRSQLRELAAQYEQLADELTA